MEILPFKQQGCICIKTALILPAVFIAGMPISGIILIRLSMLTMFTIAIILQKDLVSVTVKHMDDKPVETSLAAVAELPTAVLGMQLA